MKGRIVWITLLMAALVSSACYVAGPTPAASPAAPSGAGLMVIERERSQVWRQPNGASEGEVLATVEGHTGDQVWTRKSGQALLRWSDLYIRLYGDNNNQTGVVMKDATPTWLRLGLAAGAAQITGKPMAGQRVELTTDNARVELIGTSIMLAYHPATQITIVRVFDGQIEVSSPSDPVNTRPVRADQWALVQGRGMAEVSSRLEDLRALGRELGLWDIFHDIELDARAGFGPEGSRVPADAVEIVFVNEVVETIAPSDKPTATWTPTRTPTRTPPPSATPTLPALEPLVACIDPPEVNPGEPLRLIVLNVDPARERFLELAFAGERSRQAFQREVPSALSDLSCPGARGPGMVVQFTGEEEDVGEWQVYIQAQPTGRRADTFFRVRAPEVDQPDLTVQILGIENHEIVYGAEPWTWITYRVVNQGGAVAPAQVRLRAWSNDQVSSDYMVIEGPIQPDAVAEQRFAVGHDSGWPPGEYSVVLEVDYPDQVQESNESNNRSNTIQFLVAANCCW